MQVHLQLRQFNAIARLTAAETIRHPVSLMLILACVMAAAIAPLMSANDLGEPGRLARDSALAMHLLCGLFIAGYAACASFRRELQTGILSTILSKSVSRELFFLAKFCGVAIVIITFSYCAGAAALLGQRVTPSFFRVDLLAARLAVAAPLFALIGAAIGNFVTRRPFAALAIRYLALALTTAVIIIGFWNRQGEMVRFGADVEWRILPASLLITLALFILASLSLTLAIKLGTAPVIVITTLFLAGGLLSQHLFRSWTSLTVLADLLRGFLPDWQRLWAADLLANEARIGAGYIAYASLYTFAYLVAILAAGVSLFRRAEMS